MQAVPRGRVHIDVHVHIQVHIHIHVRIEVAQKHELLVFHHALKESILVILMSLQAALRTAARGLALALTRRKWMKGRLNMVTSPALHLR